MSEREKEKERQKKLSTLNYSLKGTNLNENCEHIKYAPIKEGRERQSEHELLIGSEKHAIN